MKKYPTEISCKEKSYTQEQKAESLRKSLIGVGYDMAALLAEGMKEDFESWGKYFIEDKINPKCIDMCDQVNHSVYNNELDCWFEPDEDIFPGGCDEWGINGLLAVNGIYEDEVCNLLYEGRDKYINEKYGENWKDKYPDPKYSI